MLAMNHALAGVLIGSALPLPVAAPLAFLSHFAMDTLPHYGEPGQKRDQSRSYKAIIFADIGLALCINFTLLFNVPNKANMLICGWLACSGDFSLVYYYLKHKTLHTAHNGLLKKFHLQFHYERPWLLFPELTLTLVLFIIFINRI